MLPIYYLYLLTFLGFPIIGLLLSRCLDLGRSKKYLKWFFAVFAAHNLLFYLGFSIKGDHPDYLILSLEYLFICLTTFLLYQSSNVYARVLRKIGTVVWLLGSLQGIVGCLLFIVIAHDYEADKIYEFHSNGIDYQTRRYCFGFVTLDDTKYSFYTYQKYRYLPFEKLINKSCFFEFKSDLSFNSTVFTVDIKQSGNNQVLEFYSGNGAKYSTIIE